MVSTHFNNIQQILLGAITDADKSVVLLVEFFTDRQLFSELLSLAKDGKKVDLLIGNNLVNNHKGGLPFQRLVDAGAQIYFAGADELPKYNFCIIDEFETFTGTYNYTYAAAHLYQNIIQFTDDEIAKEYLAIFNTIVDNLQVVTDPDEYLSEHPVTKTNIDMAGMLAEELVYQFKELGAEHDVSTQLSMVRDALSYQPANQNLLKKEQELSGDYANLLEDFCQRYPAILCNQIGLHFSWTAELIRLYHDKTHCSSFQNNKATIWDMPLIREFGALLWKNCSTVGNIFYSNPNIFVSINDLAELDPRIGKHFHEKQAKYPNYDTSPADPDQPFFINRVFDSLSGIAIEQRSAIQLKYIDDKYLWTEKELLENIDTIDFWVSQSSKNIVWTKNLLTAVKDKRPHQFELLCINIFLTKKELGKLAPLLHWKGIAKNARIDWDTDLFETHKVHLLTYPNEFSSNTHFPWTADFINTYSDKLSFTALSGNRSVPFTAELLLTYADKWLYYSHYSISSNPSIPWTAELMEQLQTRLQWPEMADNPSVPWSIELMEKYIPAKDEEYYLTKLSYNKTVWARVFKQNLTKDNLKQLAAALSNEKAYIQSA